MSTQEIPLLRESVAFAARLVAAVDRFDAPRYQRQRRANWTYRYDSEHYARESALFRADPLAYLDGRAPPARQPADVFAQRLRGKTVLTMAAKVLAHWAFRLLGRMAEHELPAQGVVVYRKAYVDDIELVFDPEQQGVVRAVYPFPISLPRQWRYLRRLQDEGRRFKLAGHAYAAADLLRLLWRRDVGALRRMESRAQVRHAREVAALGVRQVQLSDEFDIGSLDFARTLVRCGAQVVNSAHGVGKYFPVHAYPEFRVLTRRQADYYHAIGPCRYELRKLNLHRAMAGSGTTGQTAREVALVFLSQVFGGISPLIAEAEGRVVSVLASMLSGVPGVRLLYKPHPNNERPTPPEGFAFLPDVLAVNGRAGTVFASFFSTCQIDPSFAGTKVLLREQLIHPEIAFDDTEPVLDAAGLVAMIRSLARDLHATGEAPRETPALPRAAAPAHVLP